MSLAQKKLRKAKRSANRALDEGRNAAEHALEAGQAKVADVVETSYGGARRSLLGLADDVNTHLRENPAATLCAAWSCGMAVGLLFGVRATQAAYR